MTDDEKRKLYRAWAEDLDELMPFPDACRDLTCGAITRKGTPCKMTALYSSGRCKLHGGKSTGAKTPEGKARQLEGFRRWLAEKRIVVAGAQDEGTQ
ncbi:HGGxSTG domain-containing protein [Enterobacter hormaechei]|nr:HGGxSTG domain-containing protein [Enterobacter hormaechei]